MTIFIDNGKVNINKLKIPVSVYNMMINKHDSGVASYNYGDYLYNTIGNNVYITDGANRVKLTNNQFKKIYG